jgi:hypothetical protein
MVVLVTFRWARGAIAPVSEDVRRIVKAWTMPIVLGARSARLLNLSLMRIFDLLRSNAT